MRCTVLLVFQALLVCAACAPVSKLPPLPADEIKAKLAKYREEHQQKQANLEKAQDDLKKVLNSRQEATAVLLGLLN